MTEKQKKAIFLSVLLTILGAVCMPILGAAWHTKVNTSDFNEHVMGEQTIHVRDSAWKEEQRSLLLDVWCESKHQVDRRCR